MTWISPGLRIGPHSAENNDVMSIFKMATDRQTDIRTDGQHRCTKPLSLSRAVAGIITLYVHTFKHRNNTGLCHCKIWLWIFVRVCGAFPSPSPCVPTFPSSSPSFLLVIPSHSSLPFHPLLPFLYPSSPSPMQQSRAEPCRQTQFGAFCSEIWAFRSVLLAYYRCYCFTVRSLRTKPRRFVWTGEPWPLTP